MLQNPIVQFWFFFSVSLTILIQQFHLISLGGIAIIFVLILLYRKNCTGVLKRINPIIKIYPILFVLYIGFSSVLTTDSIDTILINICIASIKILLMISIMAFYLEQSKPSKILIALRSLWSKLNISWRVVEDLFLFFELTLRFLPTFQNEWESIKRGKVALGLQTVSTKRDQIRDMIKIIPGIILRNYKRSEETSKMMQLRGYGKQIPRGIVYPVQFTLNDGLVFLLITLSFIGVNFIAKI